MDMSLDPTLNDSERSVCERAAIELARLSLELDELDGIHRRCHEERDQLRAENKRLRAENKQMGMRLAMIATGTYPGTDAQAFAASPLFSEPLS
jgi:hypothetical protein